MISSLFSMVPKVAMLVIGGLVLTGSAVGASAAVGGPNLPVAVLTAIGLHSDNRSGGGIGNAPDAPQTGKEHANTHASLGAGNATDPTAIGTPVAGINHAPDAAQNGKDHANANAFLGAGNASAQGTAAAGVGITNAPDAAQTGVEHASDHAATGAGNAEGHRP